MDNTHRRNRLTPSSRMSRRWLRFGAGALLALAAAGAIAQTMPEEIQVGARVIKDFEFDTARDGVYCPECNGGAGNSRLAYIDTDHNLWVGGVNFSNGYFNPPDGKAVLVDTNTTTATEIGNGPEWVDSEQGSQLVYTRWTDGLPHQAANLQLGLAVMDGANWVAGPIDHSKGRVLPLGTDDPNGSYPFLHFQTFSTPTRPPTLYWRGLYPDSMETKIPMLNPQANITRRWVPGTLDIILTAPQSSVPPGTAPGTRQVFLYHSETGAMEQLTFDDVNKFWAFMWPAPEFDNEMVFLVMVGGDRLRIYRDLDDGAGGKAWTNVKTISMPPDMPYVTSPEPFLYNNQSWITFTLSNDPTGRNFTMPSQIAMSGIVPGVDSLRLLTSATDRVRRDPEYFITANGPYIYYNRYLPAEGAGGHPTSEGVYRVDTQLGPCTGCTGIVHSLPSPRRRR